MACIERTKKNFEAARRPWTQEIEQGVRGLVPNRWKDIAAVFTDANKPAARGGVSVQHDRRSAED